MNEKLTEIYRHWVHEDRKVYGKKMESRRVGPNKYEIHLNYHRSSFYSAGTNAADSIILEPPLDAIGRAWLYFIDPAADSHICKAGISPYDWETQ